MASQACLLLQKQLKGITHKNSRIFLLFNKSVSSTTTSVFSVIEFDFVFSGFVFSDLCKHPVDGFSAGLVDEKNIFEWSVTIIGPPDTL